MPYKDIAPLPKQATIIAGLAVVGAMAFGLALSYYKNVLFDRQLDVMSGQNDKLRQEIEDGHRTLEYLQSEQYRDKYAKQHLNKVSAGENVLILPAEESIFSVAATPEEEDRQRDIRYEQLLRDMPIIEHWQLYLLHRDQLEELKRSI